jgi:DDE family transposase
MMTVAKEESLLQLFEQIVPPERWRELEDRKRQAQIYTLPVVVWMMLLQRLDERGSQQQAVHQILAGRLDRFLPDLKRVREGTISAATGGYARACERVSISVLEKVCDEVLGELGKRIEPEPELEVPVLLVDGTSLSLEHVSGLLKDFPPCNNQYGEGHWGILKLVAFHDVQTGIALRPAWGPMYGQGAVSEQQLAEKALEQTPAGSVILGDGNFGVFSFAYAIGQSKRQVLFRLTKRRADPLGATKLLPTGETSMCWRPSRHDRNKHPELPEDAQIEGRLIVVTRKGFREALYLFTTLPDELEKIVCLYAKRWNLELDLRTLKRTMRLHHLRGKSRGAVEKELLIAVVAYGLVRAFMALAARKAGLHPRELSFTRAYGLLNAMIGKLCSVLPEQREQQLDRILRYMGKAKLPKRSKQRAYPRAVWGFRQAFPRRGPQRVEEVK